MYTRQHQTTGLQAPYEGPFKVAEQVSRSTYKIEVGTFKDGSKRYEIRHANDLKAAHPDSKTAPISRPKLGRPSKSDPQNKLNSSMASPGTPSNHFDSLPSQNGGSEADTNLVPRADTPATARNKQAADCLNPPKRATVAPSNHETSNPKNRLPASDPARGLSMGTGPPAGQPFSRPARTTRNPNPYYVDSIATRAWQATPEDLQYLNRSINRPIGAS